MKTFNEPWTTETKVNDYQIEDCNGNPVVCNFQYDGGGFYDIENASRVVDCINALAGKNPKKLNDFIRQFDVFVAILESKKEIFGGDEPMKEAYYSLIKSYNEYKI